MSALSKKLRLAEGNRLLYWCEGCGSLHQIQYGDGSSPRWGWNGDSERPTFTPSVLTKGVLPLTTAEHEAYQRGEGLAAPRPVLCHTFITDGRVQYLGDCTHHLAGQTVDLPDLPDYLQDETEAT